MLDKIRSRALEALKPPPRLSLSEWIETEMRLPSTVSALPGPVRLWPYQRGIADAISDPAIERVTIVKPVRVGFTTLLTGTLASYIANEPSPILSLQPTQDDCRDYVTSDLEPIFEATPALQGLLAGDGQEAGRNTLLSRRFPGGSLKVVAAKSPRNLRRHNVRILLIDEADAMEPSAEGNPVTLAERRTLSFANRKIILGSTPTLEETSNVLRSYARSDQRVFEVPCPDCGTFTEIKWAYIKWEPERPETAAFECPHCKAMIEERHKAQMVENGQWRATSPEVSGHAGFRLNALVSTLKNASWGTLATEFIQAKRNGPDELQVFVNTILAEGWREAADEIDESALKGRAESFGLEAIPPEVLFVTAGVDVQDDRLETTLLGWSRDECFVLAHHVIWGASHEDSTWIDLDDYLKTKWEHPNGGTLRIDAALIDSGDGGVTDLVYRFAHARYGRRVVAGKGVSGNRPALQMSKSKGTRLFLVGVDGLKASLLQRLAHGTSIRFSDSLSEEWFEQLASERRVIRYLRGRPIRQFVRIAGRRAEALDCVIYATAAKELVTANADRREEELASRAAVVKPPQVIKSKWITN